MWQKLHAIALEYSCDVLRDEVNTQTKDSEAGITGVLLVAHLSLTNQKTLTECSTPPIGLVSTATSLHVILPGIPEHRDSIKNTISKLCELWHSKQLPDGDQLTRNALHYVLKRTLKNPDSGGPSKVDIKRVHALQSAILYENIAEPSSRQLRELLLEAARTPQYYKLQEGVRFLAFLFTISPAFIPLLQRSIKRLIPGASIQTAHGIGEVYFKAWRSCEGSFKKKIEECCIQELMQSAICANPTLQKNQRIFSPIRNILKVFHARKNDRQAQAMISKLYEPILWRHLKVANSAVRANASQLFYDAFPVEDPNIQVEERSIQQGAQIQMMCVLLKDESPEVRMISIEGVASAIAKYWLILSSADLNSLVKIFVADLATDSSVPRVRAAVLKAFQHILIHCVRSHLYLKKILPKLSDSLHDIKDIVRLAMVDLLLAISNIKMIKYWDICPLEHILARLQVEKSSQICNKIVGLLLNSFFPLNGDEDTKIERCIYFIRQNKLASRKFYNYSVKFITIHDQIKFMLAILVSLRKHIKQKMIQQKAQQDTEISNMPQQNSLNGFESDQDRLLEEFADSINLSDGELDADKENNEGSAKGSQSMRKKRKKRLYTAPNKSMIMESSPSVIPPNEYTTNQPNTSIDRESSMERSSVNVFANNSTLDNTHLDAMSQATRGATETEGLGDPAIVGALIDVVCILWMSRSSDIARNENSGYRSLLEKKASKLVSVLFKYYKSSGEVVSPLIYLCSFMPHSAVSTMAGFCLSQIRKSKTNFLQQNNEAHPAASKERLEELFDRAWCGNQTDVFFSESDPLPIYIDALCNWNRGDDILELINNWLSRDVRKKRVANRKSGGKGKGAAKGVRFSDSAGLGTANPELALLLTKYMFRHPVNREILLKKNRPHVEELSDTLLEFVPEIKRHLLNAATYTNLTDQVTFVQNQTFMCSVWDSLLKLPILLDKPTEIYPRSISQGGGTRTDSIGSKKSSNNTSIHNTSRRSSSFGTTPAPADNNQRALIVIEDQLDWAEEQSWIIPSDPKNGDGTFALRILNSLINACSNIVTLGICDANFVGLCLQFAKKVLDNVMEQANVINCNTVYSEQNHIDGEERFDLRAVCIASVQPICR